MPNMAVGLLVCITDLRLDGIDCQLLSMVSSREGVVMTFATIAALLAMWVGVGACRKGLLLTYVVQPPSPALYDCRCSRSSMWRHTADSCRSLQQTKP